MASLPSGRARDVRDVVDGVDRDDIGMHAILASRALIGASHSSSTKKGTPHPLRRGMQQLMNGAHFLTCKAHAKNKSRDLPTFLVLEHFEAVESGDRAVA